MSKLARVLDALEKTFGPVKVPRRADPFDLLVYQTCGYPASDAACTKGYAALARDVGTSAADILRATRAKLVKAMRAGGIVPELRAGRLVEIAEHARSRADLTSRATLKRMPSIGDPGADKILLFARVEPIAAVPSNALQVPVRIGLGSEQRSYAATYRSVQRAMDRALPKTYAARIRAYLLLRRHGQDICKRSRPRCELCPLTRDCDYFARGDR